MAKVQCEPVVKNFEDTSKFLYEFGAQKTNYNKPMPKKLEDLSKRIAQKVTQENPRLTLTDETSLEQALMEAEIYTPAAIASVSKLTLTGIVTDDDFRFIDDRMSKTLNELDINGESVGKNNSEIRSELSKRRSAWLDLEYAQLEKDLEERKLLNEASKAVQKEGKYDEIIYFGDGLVTVKLNDKYGFIDKTGSEVIPAKYDDAWRFVNGLAEVELDGKHGFIDKTGNEVVPVKYDEVGFYDNGFPQSQQDAVRVFRKNFLRIGFGFYQ